MKQCSYIVKTSLLLWIASLLLYDTCICNLKIYIFNLTNHSLNTCLTVINFSAINSLIFCNQVDSNTQTS